jgi:predicted regulator of amino acid metabolism with ACT domain
MTVILVTETMERITQEATLTAVMKNLRETPHVKKVKKIAI